MLISAEYQAELRNKYNPDGSDLRKAQYAMLNLLIFLDKICKEHNLTYWLDSGTLLGAVRHQGFIPWDDDMDVCMPRKDAKRLKKIMQDQIFENHIILQNDKTDPGYLNSGWMTLRDIKIEYASDNIIMKYLKYRGVQIDIFEVETGIPYWTKSIPNIINKYLISKPGVNNSKSIYKLKQSIIFSKIQNRIIVPLCRLFRKNNKIYNYAIGNPFRAEHDEEEIFPLKTMKFEGYEFFVPNKYSKYLSTLYGDWEEVPSEDKIQTHNVNFRFIKGNGN